MNVYMNPKYLQACCEERSRMNTVMMCSTKAGATWLFSVPVSQPPSLCFWAPDVDRGRWATDENTIPWNLLLEQRHVSYRLKKIGNLG